MIFAPAIRGRGPTPSVAARQRNDGIDDDDRVKGDGRADGPVPEAVVPAPMPATPYIFVIDVHCDRNSLGTLR